MQTRAQTWEDIVAGFDRDIEKLEKQLLLLRRQRNLVTPCYQLANETIERILLIIKYDAEHHGNNGAFPKSSIWTPTSVKWVPASNICRRFREAALGSTKLWSTVNTNHKHKEWTHLCFERAGNYPLRLSGSVRFDGHESTMSLLANTGRAGAMCVQIVHGNREDKRPFRAVAEEREHAAHSRLVEEYLHTPRSRSLTFLELFNNINIQSHDNHRPRFLNLSRMFLAGSSVSLTYLLLERVRFEGVPHMPSLRRLVLLGIINDLQCSQLRAVLQQAPQLDTLQIDGLYEDGPSGRTQFPGVIPDIKADWAVHLPNLASLQLGGGLAQISQAVRIFPSSQCIPLFDLRVNDAPRDYTNPEMYMIHLPTLSQAIQARIADHLTRYPNSSIKTCSVDVLESPEVFKRVSLEDTATDDNRAATQHIFHYPCPVDAHISNIVCHVEQVEVYDCHYPLGFLLDITKTSRMRTLLFEGPELGEYQEEIEHALSLRAQEYKAPVECVVMRFLRQESEYDDPISPPSKEVQEELEQKWMGMGWVTTIKWIYEYSRLY